jgi:hypothetical protein
VIHRVPGAVADAHHTRPWCPWQGLPEPSVSESVEPRAYEREELGTRVG